MYKPAMTGINNLPRGEGIRALLKMRPRGFFSPHRLFMSKLAMPGITDLPRGEDIGKPPHDAPSSYFPKYSSYPGATAGKRSQQQTPRACPGASPYSAAKAGLGCGT